ncbi:Rieske 2Fe-2S domain-containing protein [Frankia sp. Cr1]|uniref:Rieske 2Fe-2S domain-containing protein n=1 Tax=Frankia sp. Cr1 TaxID=3073931 RepID=UPI003A1019AA
MRVFPQNQWYVAAWSREVGRDLFARTICGEQIVFYRTLDGRVVALADRCVHRRYPLSLGTLRGDDLECGYHGFTYDCSGTCIQVPGQERVPRTARVRSYRVVEQANWIWVWIGEEAKADLAAVPDNHWLDDPGWTMIGGMAPLPARYQLLVDNLLDLSHETYLHAGFIGTPEVAATPIQTEVDHAEQVLRISRHMHGVECPPFYEKSTGFSTPVDRWQDIEYRPVCSYVLHSRIAPAGVLPGDAGGDTGAVHAKILYGITPETEHSTFDFWAVARDFALGDAEVSDFFERMNQEVVQQDVDALTLLERVIADEEKADAVSEHGRVQELSIAIDAGALAGRKMIREMLASPTPTS